MLTERQQLILNLVVDAYLESGKPVGSKGLAERADVEWSPSTVRGELAELEQAGYLTHPTPRPGGCPPTPAIASTPTRCSPRGAGSRRRAGRGLDLTQMRREVDEAMRETTADAVPDHRPARRSRPRRPLGTARIHRVEVLLLQPRVAMVVVIASNGGVTKRVFTFEKPRRPRASSSGRRAT